MIIIIGLVILVAAVVAGVAGVLSQQRQRACAHPPLRGVRLPRDRLHRHAVPVRHRGRGARPARAEPAAGRRAPHLPPRPRRPAADSRQSRRETAAVSQDRDDLLGQREAARAYTASTPGNGPAGGGRDPGGDGGGQRSKWHLFGPRSASPQAAAPPVPAANGPMPPMSPPTSPAAD